MPIPTGRIAQPKRILSIRPLTREDLGQLREKRANVATPAKLRDSHHNVARLIASGMKMKDVAIRSGYSLMRISTLMGSPAFEELVASYRARIDEAFIESQDDYYELATANMLKAERQIADRLDEADEAGETLPIRELALISRDAADRFGYGKKQTNVNVNVDFAAQLERAIARSGKTLEPTTGVAPSRSGAVRAGTPSSRTAVTAELPQPFRRRA